MGEQDRTCIVPGVYFSILGISVQEATTLQILRRLDMKGSRHFRGGFKHILPHPLWGQRYPSWPEIIPKASTSEAGVRIPSINIHFV